jgi:flagellin
MQINTNLDSLSAQQSYRRSALAADASVQRLSSGLRINSARDDAAGLAITTRLTSSVAGLGCAARNINDGISLLQVASGALSQIVDNFQRLRELAVQSGNGSNNESDRKALQREANELLASNVEIASHTQFNRLNLLDGSYSNQLQVGANASETIALAIPAVFEARAGTFVRVDVPLKQVNITGQVAGPLGAGDLTINGTPIGASTAGASAGQSAGSAYAIAAAIAAAKPVGITATATNSLSGAAAAAGGAIPNGALSVNGIPLGPISGADATALAASAAAAFAAAAGASGISASSSGATLTLTAADGRDISIAGAGPAGLLGLANGVRHGSVNLTNEATTSVNKVVIGGGNPGAAGFSSGAQMPTLTGATVNVERQLGSSGEAAIDLSSVDGAAAALAYIDGKIDGSNAIRSLLGATENRLAQVYNHVVEGEAIVSAARSRICDTDYASETTQLTRSKILQQAGVAIIAQANTLPNQALLLLR